MDDVTRYHEMNKHIASIESLFDVVQVISSNGLLKEIKSSSLSYIFSEMTQNLEAIKKIHEETYEKLRSERMFSRYVSPF